MALVYPHEYAPAAKSCIDLKRTFDNSDAVLQASAIAVGDDLPGFALVRLSPKIAYKPPSGLDGTIELHIDLDEIARPHAGDGYVLFLTRNDPGSWQIVCPFRALATVDGAGTVRSASLRATDLAPLLPADVRELDAALRALAR